MRQHKVFLRHELLKYNSEKSTAKSSALENYISSANLSLSGCSSAEPNSVSVGRCKFQLKKLYLQTVKKVDHLPMFYYENGKDITTNFYSEGKITANIDTLFKNQPTRNNIETLEKSVITTCNFNKLEELCSVSLTAANFSRYILGNLMIEMSRRISSLQYMTAKEKYIQLLEENPNIILRAPLGMIATYLGISQETLSRIRSDI